MWGLLKSTPTRAAQVSSRSCSHNISRVCGSRTSQELKNRLVGFECLLCTREPMNLQRLVWAAAATAFTASEQQAWIFGSWKHLQTWAAQSSYVKYKAFSLGMASGTLHPRVALQIVGSFLLLTFWTSWKAANMNPQTSVSKHFENRELNACFKTLMFQTS